MRPFRIGLICSLAILFVRAAQAQEPSEVRFFREVGEAFDTYLKDTNARLLAHDKETQVLKLLGEAADSLGGMQAGLVGATARAKVGAARQRAETDPPSEDPVPAVIDAFARAIEPGGIGDTPDRMRSRAFASLVPLEEDLLRKATAFDQESRNLRNLGNRLHERSRFFEEAAVNAVYTSIRIQRHGLR